VDVRSLVIDESNLTMSSHVAERVDDVERFHRAYGDGGKQGIELEEVLLVDENRVPVLASCGGLADRAGDVESHKSSPQDQEPFPLHGQRIACRLAPSPAGAYLSPRL